ncbi:hypothetical protein [Bradyrhizobium sp. S3.9.1]|uniref:hypothetical protein n=1 Tax=Bradyrhizobium sp. S3.9.1 TaxID=3156431 RepID=UPI003395916D
MGSIPPAGSIEYPQREIVNLITHAGLAPPDDADLSQLARSVQSMLMNSQDDAGTANAYQVTMHPAPNAYYKYLMVICKIGNANTGPSVLNVNALGPKPIVHIDGSALSASELRQGAIVAFMFDGVNFQMVWSSTGVIGIPGAPIFLTGNRVLYVDWANGNDATYDGTAAAFVAGTIHGPFKTPQRATNEINKWNLNGFGVTIHLADSPSYPSFRLPQAPGSGSCSWQGNLSNPGNVVITGVDNSAISGQNSGAQEIFGMKLSSSGNPLTNNDNLCALNIAYGTQVGLHDVIIGTCYGPMLSIARGSVLTLYGQITLMGNSVGNPYSVGAFIYCYFSALVQWNSLSPPNLNIPAPINLQYFVVAAAAGNLALGFGTLTGPGNVTGTKYLSQTNAVIDTSGRGVSYYPGTVAGSTTSGGQYV